MGPATAKGRMKVARKPKAIRPGQRSGGRMPAFRPVQLATLVDRVPTGERWLHEMKYDGYRCLIAVGGGEARAYMLEMPGSASIICCSALHWRSVLRLPGWIVRFAAAKRRAITPRPGSSLRTLRRAQPDADPKGGRFRQDRLCPGEAP